MRGDERMDNLSVSTSRLPRIRTVHRVPGVEGPLNLVLFGPPGAGKGTQADRIAARYNVPKISTGDMLRKAIQDGTRIGQIVRDTLQCGKLVGDDLMISLVGERLENPDTARGFVLDGFPRTIPQASALDALLADRGPSASSGQSCVTVIALVVHADEVIRRLAGRGREDDEAFVIKERLAVYSRETEPVLEYYRRRGVANILDGNRPMDAVSDAIERVVKNRGREQGLGIRD
jgi:adenylate kinase